MTILFYQSNCVVRKNGKNNCTTVMMYDLSFIGHVTFLNGVHRDVKNTATKNCLAVECLGKVFVCLRHLAVSGLQLTDPCSIWQLPLGGVLIVGASLRGRPILLTCHPRKGAHGGTPLQIWDTTFRSST